MKGLTTSLQRMSIHDGPGIRTVIFLKGCDMRCKWCHNPETWSKNRQIQYINSKCVACHTCVSVCPEQSIKIGETALEIDFEKCTACGICSEMCCSGALSIVGKETSAVSLWDEVKVDLPYFNNSGGGITLSGGEPLLQFEFVKEFLTICKQNGVNTAVETNMSVDWSIYQDLLPLVDLWMCDLKLFDEKKHLEWTGIDNAHIKENIIKLAGEGCNMVVRTPVVPGVNDNEEELKNISQFLAGINVRQELLAFHTLGFNKYESMGILNEMKDCQPLSTDRLNELKNACCNIGYGCDSGK